MNAQELMKPRFEVIADYPNCPFKVKDLIYNKFKYIFGTDNTNQVLTLKDIEKYPHLFKKLNWWDKRNIEDMPTYIKSESQVVKPKWEMEEWRGKKYWRAYDLEAAKYNMSLSFKLDYFEPATEQEYLEFKKAD